MDTDRTAADLVAVEHHVVAAAHRGLRVGAQIGLVVDRGRGEGMMQGNVALRFVVPLEHRKVGDPQRLPAGFDQIQILTQFQPHRAHEITGGLVHSGAEEDRVPALRAGRLQDGGQRGVVEELGDRRVDAVATLGGVLDLHPRHALGAVLGGMRADVVDLLARERRASRGAQRDHTAILMIGPVGEDLEFAGLHQFGDVGEFHRIAQVRLVRTVATHRFGVGHARELAQLHVHHFAEDFADHRFGGVLHVAFAHPREFHVELGEFQLAVGAQRFVAEAARDLVVAVEAGHHQDLLEQLRRLRQRIELARMHARGHQEVARALGRGLGEDRGFDVLEAARVQPAAQRLHQTDAGAHHLLHLGAAQVEIAIGEAGFLAGVLVGVERQRLGLVHDLDRGRHDLDLAGPDLLVHRMARTHGAGDAQTIFVAEPAGDLEQLDLVAFDQHLHDALMVAQIDEHLMALDAGGVDPAANRDGLADQRLVDEAAEVGTHGGDSGCRIVRRLPVIRTF